MGEPSEKLCRFCHRPTRLCRGKCVKPKGPAMTEQKYRVPKGMLEAVEKSLRANNAYLQDGLTRDVEDIVLPLLVKAALRWLSQNPIVPTESQEKEVHDYVLRDNPLRPAPSPWSWIKIGWIEGQRRMFLVPEPDREAVKDLLYNYGDQQPSNELGRKWVDERILEAYRRGRESR